MRVIVRREPQRSMNAGSRASKTAGRAAASAASGSANPSHLYAEDLDLFGAGGLFELLVTTRTHAGEDVLAGWLLRARRSDDDSRPAGGGRRTAPLLDLREDLAVLGPDVEAAVRTDDLKAGRGPPTTHGPVAALRAAAGGGASIGLVIQWVWTGHPPDVLLLALARSGRCWRSAFGTRVHHVTHGIEQREHELRVLATLMERIEREPAKAAAQALRGRLRATGRAPADEIRRLARLVEMLSSGHNQIFAPISALLLLGTQLAFAVEQWRARCGPVVRGWLAAVAEYEALSALATYAAEHPEDTFPDVDEGPAAFSATPSRIRCCRRPWRLPTMFTWETAIRTC